MLRRRVPCALTGLLLLVANPSGARVVDGARVGSWRVAAVTDDATDAVVECRGQTESPAGIGLVLSNEAATGWSLGLTGNLGARPGESYPVRLQVDDGPVRTGTASVEDGNKVRIPLGDPAGFLGEFTRGRRLDADAGAERLTFPLRGTRAVVAEVNACARRMAGRVELAQATGVPAAPPARTDRPAAPATDKRMEALTVQANVLSRAKVAGFELQPQSVPARLQGHDVTWRAGDVAGSLRVVGPEGAPNADGIRADLVASDIRSCPDRFTAEANPAPDGRGVSLFTTCAGEKGWAADYLAVPRGPQGVYVFAVVSAPDKADALRTIAAALRTAAVDIAGRPPTSTP